MRRALVQPLICLLLMTALLTVCAKPSASVAADTEPQPPAGTMVVRDVQGGGAQVYACRNTAPATFGWVLVGPKAVLINDDGTDFGTHSAGPTWAALDGSTIAADGAHPLQQINRAGAVPMLLLAVTSSHGSGVLSGFVSSVARIRWEVCRPRWVATRNTSARRWRVTTARSTRSTAERRRAMNDQGFRPIAGRERLLRNPGGKSMALQQFAELLCRWSGWTTLHPAPG
jgi:hypothetical protein